MPNNYVLLQRVEVGAAGAASISFTNIPQTGYTDLKVVSSSRTNYAGVTDALLIRFNSDSTTANYSQKRLYGLGSGTPASDSFLTGTAEGGIGTGNSGTASTFGSSEFYIPNYTSSNQKSFSLDGVSENNATAALAILNAAKWTGTASIATITILPELGTSILANSTFSLYGLSAVGVTPTVAPKASGGSITTDGTYWYHTFRSSGFFVPQVGLTCDALVVAGGGGGGNAGSGGGGAGGFLGFTSQSFASGTSYTATVGAGGAIGIVGVDSQLGTLTLVKGGGIGGNPTTRPGGDGGSGGGAQGGFGNYPGGNPTSGQGFAGGAGTSAAAGSGGGAGAIGATGGAGGIGLNTYSSWATATSTGVSGYYAGGGGGGGNPGGTGGGGSGATAGIANTGGGGGGANGSSAGGSGVVIIRYPIV